MTETPAWCICAFFLALQCVWGCLDRKESRGPSHGTGCKQNGIFVECSAPLSQGPSSRKSGILTLGIRSIDRMELMLMVAPTSYTLSQHARGSLRQ